MSTSFLADLVLTTPRRPSLHRADMPTTDRAAPRWRPRDAIEGGRVRRIPEELDPLGAEALALPAQAETVRVTDACTACGACIVTCPERALRRAPKRPLVLDDACTACWACIEICPAGAIVEVR